MATLKGYLLGATFLSTLISFSGANAAEGQPYADRLSGDWGGTRSRIANTGVELGLVLKTEATGNFNGGTEKRTFYLSNLDVTANFDFEKIAGLKRSRLFVWGLGNTGGKPNEVYGDNLGSSNIQAANTFKLYEAYWSQGFTDEFTVLAGLKDLNVDFYATDSAGQFRSSGFGAGNTIAQTGTNGPSIFPTTAPNITLKYITSEYYAQLGIFNALSGHPTDRTGTHVPLHTADYGLLNIAEVGYTPKLTHANSKFSLGYWGYTKESNATDTTKAASKNSGFYLMADHPFTESISAFLRYGTASETLSRFRSEIETGVVFKNLVEGRPNDKFGIGYITAQVSPDWSRVNNTKDSESALEINYLAEMGCGISLSPSYQYLFNPGISRTGGDVSLWAARLRASF